MEAFNTPGLELHVEVVVFYIFHTDIGHIGSDKIDTFVYPFAKLCVGPDCPYIYNKAELVCGIDESGIGSQHISIIVDRNT